MNTLVARLDNMGDVLLAGPAVRAVAAASERVTFLAGPHGAAAAALLPGVDDVLTWNAPWVAFDAAQASAADVYAQVDRLAALRLDKALIFGSFHQSPLPLALVLRMAGVPWIGAMCEDYPGSLLDLRLPPTGDIPEPQRALTLARAAGFALPDGDDGRLACRQPLPPLPAEAGPPGYVALHPGASVPARRPSATWYRDLVRALVATGHDVVVTGSPAERELACAISEELPRVRNLAAATDLPALASVFAHARAVIAPNTGPAHLAAAVQAPVVSLFAPVVPAARWAPYGVPTAVLGDQSAPCRGTRARECPVPGHPCLHSVTPDDVLAAIDALSSTLTEGVPA
jgi:ADP-heptose:LPS heptosyltransferase